MGLYTKVNLAESPAKAAFLSAPEKAWLQQRHAESKVPASCAPLQLGMPVLVVKCSGQLILSYTNLCSWRAS